MSERKPRQPYSAEERAQKMDALAMGMELTVGNNMPQGSMVQAAAIAGLPRQTAQGWVALSDEGFSQARQQAKRAIHGDALAIMELASQAVRQRLSMALASPDDLRKLNPRDLIVTYGTAYDKAALAAGEGGNAALAAVGAAVVAQLWQRTQSAPMAGQVVDAAPGPELP